MGIRQPSKTRAFLAQATAGAQKQQKAREELKKPALGGSAQAGTAMVTAGTQQQQAATQNLVTTGQQAAKDLTFGDNVGSSTQTFIGGTATTPAATTPATTPTTTTTPPTATAATYTGGVSEKYKTPDLITSTATGEDGNVADIEANNAKINTAITSITTNITQLETALTTATGADRAAIQAEIDRLKKELQRYQDMITKENLGQIAGPSTFETEMMKTQKLLAGDGGVDGDVGKLAALFGGRKRKFGALESQIYGKDLEMLQEAAGEALRERGLAEQAADVAEEEYQETLKKSQKGYEEKSADASKKVEILNKTPDEFAKGNFTRADMEKLFGTSGIVDRLFEFDANNKVTKTKYSSTREALVGRKDELTTEAGKGETALTKAKEVQVAKEIAPFNDLLFGAIEPVTGERRGGIVKTMRDRMDKMNTYYQESMDYLNNLSGLQSYGGISQDRWRMGKILEASKDYKTAVSNLETKLLQAQKDNDIQTLKKAQNEINDLWNNYQRTVKEHHDKMKKKFQTPDLILR